MNGDELGGTSLEDLQKLFTSHLRTRLMLRDVLQAEREILVRIVDSLQRLPERLRDEVVQGCVARAAEGLVCE